MNRGTARRDEHTLSGATDTEQMVRTGARAETVTLLRGLSSASVDRFGPVLF